MAHPLPHPEVAGRMSEAVPLHPLLVQQLQAALLQEVVAPPEEEDMLQQKQKL